ncbi:MAG: hypothetical protein ABIT01_19680 [Thermoanaerobaculia bacterium]
MNEPPEPGSEFERDVELKKPGIVGARWWHKSLEEERQVVGRRSVLKTLAIAGGIMGAAGLGLYAIGRAFRTPAEPVSFGTRRALEVQRLYGWNFGARDKALVFDGITETAFVRGSLERLGEVMTPKHNTKYSVGTLLESLTAQPTATLPEPDDGYTPEDSAEFKKLIDVVVPAVTPQMEEAYLVGEAFARLCQGHPALSALVDLPGPEAVAFAAGACKRFEPVLLIDNWPHPHGVVPSHLALAALAYYQPRFTEQAASRTETSPLFILDRARLAPYSEESDRFDNRYYANMPSMRALAGDGIRGLFYVVRSASDLPEPGDLTRVLAEGTRQTSPSSVAVRALALSDFNGRLSDPGTTVYYGGSAQTDGSFFVNYPFDPTFSPPFGQKIAPSTSPDHVFVPGAAKSTPSAANVGKVAVLVTASGLLIGAALNRRGSMNRFSGGWSG